MSSYLVDSRTETNNSNSNNSTSSYLYQAQPPSSPPVTSINNIQQTQQSNNTSNAQQQQPQEDIFNGIVVDYLVSPKPSTSRIQTSNTNPTNTTATETIENTCNNNKRRSSSCSSCSSTTSSSSLTLKPIKLANDINNSKEQHALKRDHPSFPSHHQQQQQQQQQVKPTNTTSTTPSSSSLVITPPKSATNTTTTMRFEQQKKKSKRLHKKEKLKEAKNEYEERIEEYFHQLTIGCQQKDCRNKFCASGRGGILSLQPQAALIMSIQLASMPGSRLCQLKKNDISDSDSTSSSNSLKRVVTQQGNKKRDGSNNNKGVAQQQQQQAKPFLQSLFTSTPFIRLLTKQQQQEDDEEEQAAAANSSFMNDSHWSTDFWKLFSHFSGSTSSSSNNTPSSDYEEKDKQEAPKKKKETKPNNKKDRKREFVSDEGYYQIDHDDYRSDSSSSEDSINSSGMLLAISPISVDLDLAVEYLHRAIVTQSISEEKMDTWCRSVFQSWEGIGTSFLSHSTKGDINLDELTRFYQLVIHDDKKLKDPRQIRIMESISDSFETLLDRMTLNVESLTEIESMEDAGQYQLRIMHEWCRSLMAVLQWIICCKEKKDKEEQDGLATLVVEMTLDDISTNQKRAASIASTSQIILTQKLIQVLSKIAHKKKSVARKIMKNMLANLDLDRMNYIIQDLHQYLLDHYHTGPYKHGLEDTVIMTLKCLELLYQANMKLPSAPILSPSTFYSAAICKKLNIKNEYRIWKRVLLYGEGRHSTLITRQGETEHQRRSRLFMTTTSTSTMLPYPFENEYQFSWFSYPFLLPPSIKRKIVLIDAMSQMSLEYEDACVNHTLVVHAQKLLSEAPHMLKNLETNLRSATCPYLLLEIRREHFVADTLSQMSRKWSDLKKPLKVKFIEGGEEGMDQGGVQKEFFGVLFEKLVSPDVGLFVQDESTRLCWIRPVMDHDIRLYEMVGVMMGLSIYNGVIMNLQFPKILWKILVMPNEALIDVMAERQQLFTLEDLEEGWPDLGSGLLQLLNWQDGDVEDIFCRDYEISMDIFGQGIVTRSLMPNKDDPVVPVTNENREQYVKDYCTYFMYTVQKEQLLALRRGMWSVIGSRALNLCTAEELEMVACGLRQGPDALDLNMAELESIAEYDDGYNVEHPTIRQFWSVVHHDLTNDQKKQLLLFVTASDRVPVGGLKELSFYIQRNGPDSDRLPTALTCFSRLLLPEYATRQKLKDRLITAIENTKGFGLV